MTFDIHKTKMKRKYSSEFELPNTKKQKNTKSQSFSFSRARKLFAKEFEMCGFKNDLEKQQKISWELISKIPGSFFDDKMKQIGLDKCGVCQKRFTQANLKKSIIINGQIYCYDTIDDNDISAMLKRMDCYHTVKKKKQWYIENEYDSACQMFKLACDVGEEWEKWVFESRKTLMLCIKRKFNFKVPKFLIYLIYGMIN